MRRNTGDVHGKVLVVDDDHLVLASLERVLRASGFSIVACDSGLVALAHAAETPYEVIVSDVSMPGFSGIDLLRALREKGLPVPVILATGAPDAATARQARALGASEYLLKPVPPDVLVEAVRRALRQEERNEQMLK